VPAAISRRQLLIALAKAKLITEAEALAAAKTGEVPAVINTVFTALPKEQALAARITWATMTVVERDHPLIQAVIDAKIATPEQIDALFRTANNL
jgi:phenylpyruvate tautomerase PptA (4-oxalocrotonate tautomerase family)